MSTMLYTTQFYVACSTPSEMAVSLLALTLMRTSSVNT